MSQRVLVADDLGSAAVAVLREAGLEVEVRTGLPPDELQDIIGDYQALVVRSATKVTAELLQKAGRLQVVGRAGVGVDNVDLPAATARGIVVMNTPGGSAVTVAELALAHMLALARHLTSANESVKAGRWEKKKFQGHELAGKVLGVVGLGNIGQVVAERALALGLRVIAHDPFVSEEVALKLGVALSPLSELFRQADIVSLHVPLNQQTRGLVNQRVLSQMKKTALLVNCARGGIVDELALARALGAGTIAGAALDVFEKEPPAPDHPLLKLPNVICTPHLGASTEEAQEAVSLAIAQQLVAYLRNGELRNAVNVPNVPREVAERFGPLLLLGERLGSLVAQLAPDGFGQVRVEFAGELGGLPQRLLTAAALTGLLRRALDVPVNEVNALLLARERGLKIIEEHREESQDYTSLLTVEVEDSRGRTTASGTVYGRQEARLVRVGGFRLEAVPEGDIIIIENQDAPGVVGNVGTVLGNAGVNIGRIMLARDDQGRAFALVNLDSPASPEVLDQLRGLPHIQSVRQIRL